ncbi:hypothetical protein PsorP6_004992 [Peronosclerospora sorghi]|uniref:Uncharacterized protein n=1 Tax=Peronosclerospora sorghi TaxID=230839 RepID=A0ACC0W406_9STRA|nr:hypothetical protein PsorP6_004992 [Peronosclerospora sorghi]
MDAFAANGRWKVLQFSNEHNHDLLTPTESALLAAYRGFNEPSPADVSEEIVSSELSWEECTACFNDLMQYSREICKKAFGIHILTRKTP